MNKDDWLEALNNNSPAVTFYDADVMRELRSIITQHFSITEDANRRIFADIKNERMLQDEKWGEQNHHPYKWLAILGEEIGECNKAILESSLLDYRKELIQAAAVAVAAIECLERGKWENKE